MATEWCLGMDSGRVPTIPRAGKSGSLCLHCTNNRSMLNTLLTFWRSVLLVHSRQRVPMWPAPHKNCRCWVSNKHPRLTTFHACCHNSSLGESGVPRMTPLGEDPWNVVPGFSQISPMHLTLEPFPIINHSCECNYTPSYWIPVHHWTWGLSRRPQYTTLQVSVQIWHCSWGFSSLR